MRWEGEVLEEEEIEDVAAEEDEAEEEAEEEEDSEVIVAEVDETEGTVFDTSADSYTAAPGSTQHYAWRWRRVPVPSVISTYLF